MMHEILMMDRLKVLFAVLDEPSLTIVRDAAGDYSAVLIWARKGAEEGEAIGYGSTLWEALDKALNKVEYRELEQEIL